MSEIVVAFFRHYLDGRSLDTEDRLAGLLRPDRVAARLATGAVAGPPTQVAVNTSSRRATRGVR